MHGDPFKLQDMPDPTRIQVESQIGKAQLIEAVREFVEKCRPGELAQYDARILRHVADDIDRKLEEKDS